MELWENAVHIFKTNKDVEAENRRKLRLFEGTLRIFRAKNVQVSVRADKGKQLMPTEFNKCGGLIDKLELKIGAKIIILLNINLEDGIYNGAIGTIVSLPNNLNGAVEVLLEKVLEF